MSKRVRSIAGYMVCVLLMYVFLGVGGERVQAESGYTVSGHTITITHVTNNDLCPVIQSAIDYARKADSSGIYTIKVPAGSYNLSGCIHVYGNVCLDLTGVTLTCTASKGNMLSLGTIATNMDASKESGYGSRGNVTIIGGTWIANNSNSSSIARIAHAKNIRFEGCTFSGGGCFHQVEVTSIDGFTVKDCTFKDMALKTGPDGKKEALQLDIPCTAQAFKYTILDGTPMKNVKITGCTFKNVPRGVGTHSMLIGTYHTNINISNNTFENVDGECIIALNYRNCDIRNNQIRDCGAGIVFQSFKPLLNSTYTSIFEGTKQVAGTLIYDADTLISGNRIYLDPDRYADEYVGIKVYGYDLERATRSAGSGPNDLIPANNYYISNVNVIGNEIETSGYGIHFSDVKDSAISGNEISYNDMESGQDGIAVDSACENIFIEDNQIYDASRYGISVSGESTVRCITDNEIDGTAWYGICVEQESVVTNGIDDNIIRNCNDNGIQIDNYSTVGGISGNTVTDCKWHGINLLNYSGVTGKIASNTIKNCAKNGIFLNRGCYAASITGNTLSNNQRYSIALYEDSYLTGDISSNTIKGSKSHAIQLNLDCHVSNISKNKITDSKGKGIVIETGCSVKKAINNNTISKTNLEGIFIHSIANKLEIKGNTIKNCGRSPIIINTKQSYKIVVTKNKITTKKGQKALSVESGKVKSDIKP